jgi:hypothetical protein
MIDLIADLLVPIAQVVAKDPAQINVSKLKSAVLALKGMKELLSLIAEVRSGKSPMELLAGLQTFGEDELLPALCTPQMKDGQKEEVREIACTVAATGLIAGRLKDPVAWALEETPSWSEDKACESIATAIDLSTRAAKDFKDALERMGATDSPLLQLMEAAKEEPISCEKKPLETHRARAALSRMRSIYMTAFDMTVSIKKWRSNGAPSDRAQQMLGWIQTIFEDTGFLLGRGEDPKFVAMLGGFKAIGSIMRGEYADGIRQALVVAGGVSELLPDSKARKYLMLLGDLAQAKTAAEVQTALEGAAAPVGSWRLKRRGFVASISAVVGLHTGAELVLGVKSAATQSSSTHDVGYGLGLMASLGLDLAWPIMNSRSSAGLYFSVLDVGQLAYARLGTVDGAAKDDVTAGSKASFLGVLSPGVYARFGLCRTPFTLGMGFSYAPELRQYLVDTTKRDSDAPKAAFDTMRFGIFLGVDLTLLPF